MQIVITLFALATIFLTSHAHQTPQLIQLLRPRSGAAGNTVPGVNCLSWRLGVETNNIIDWKTVPEQCEGYVGNYMLGYQYRRDSKTVCTQAKLYAEGLALPKDGRNIWIFDVDETTLSNLPYYADHGFGVEPYNSTTFNEWVMESKAPALPESLELYNKILSLGIKPVFLTGRREDKRNVTVANLKNVGYGNWEKLILKTAAYKGKTSLEYKSTERKKLVEMGYRIVGNIGDQWSDLMGSNRGRRTFKLPDPMYYIP